MRAVSETLIFHQRLFQGCVANPDSKPDATFFIFDMKIDYRIGTYLKKTPKLQIRMQHYCFIRLLMSGSGLTWSRDPDQIFSDLQYRYCL
jgi:hypothetical protein